MAGSHTIVREAVGRRQWVLVTGTSTAIGAGLDAQVIAETDMISLGKDWHIRFSGAQALGITIDATGNIQVLTAKVGFRLFAADGVTNFSTDLPAAWPTTPATLPKVAGTNFSLVQVGDFDIDFQSIVPISALWTQFTLRAVMNFRNLDGAAAHNAQTQLKARYEWLTDMAS